MRDNKQPLKIYLHGFDIRGSKTLIMYLQRYCTGAAQVVNQPELAEADVFDFDVKTSKALLESHMQSSLHRPVLVLSLRETGWADVLHIKKPVNANDMVQVMAKAKKSFADFAKEEQRQEPSEDLTAKKGKPKKPELTKSSNQVSEKQRPGRIPKAGKETKKADAGGVALPEESHKSKEAPSPQTGDADNLLQDLDDWFDL